MTKSNSEKLIFSWRTNLNGCPPITAKLWITKKKSFRICNKNELFKKLKKLGS